MTETKHTAVTTRGGLDVADGRENPEGLAVGGTPKRTVVGELRENVEWPDMFNGGNRRRERGGDRKSYARNNGQTGSVHDGN